jgi:hypothetical protein
MDVMVESVMLVHLVAQHHVPILTVVLEQRHVPQQGAAGEAATRIIIAVE